MSGSWARLSSAPRFLLLAFVVLTISSCDLGGLLEEAPPATLVPDDALVNEQFEPGGQGSWHTESDDIGESVILNERLVIRVNAPNTVQYATLREPLLDDFMAQVDVASLDGSPSASYGLLFRMNELNEFYRFDITGDGRFMVEKADSDGSWVQYLNNWKKSESILTGQNVWNTLRVDAVGSEMSFYINNSLVHTLTDESLASGKIGLDVGTFSQASAAAVFDSLIVQNP